MDYSNVLTILEILGSNDVTTLHLTNDAYHVIDFLDTLEEVYEKHVITGTPYGHKTLIKIHLQFYVSVPQSQSWGFLRPVQQPGSYWDRSSELPLVGLEPTEVTAYD